ncbi:MAG: ATP-binding protein, partial [Planctomycetia bacterium]|nr:ATP-binding protein [Planctomycetia bacterium]
LPVDEVWISQGAANAEYESQMEMQLASYRERGIRTVAFGDIFLEDLRAYRERNLEKVGMQALFPIWKRDTRELLETFLAHEFRSITCCIDTRRLDDSFVGREIDRQFLADLPPDVDPCGENGEFHSFACGGPLFASAIDVRRGETRRRDSFLFCDLIPI